MVGPGLGRGPRSRRPVRRRHSPGRLLAAAPAVPAVVDADGLNALGDLDTVRRGASERRVAPTVLTPHEGEYARLVGRPPADDRMPTSAAVGRRTRARSCCSKGSPTVVAAPGRAGPGWSPPGTSRLATAGTGDVLSGVIGAFLARGVPAAEAAGLGRPLPRAGRRARPAEGLVASDLPDLVSQLAVGRRRGRGTPVSGPSSHRLTGRRRPP